VNKIVQPGLVYDADIRKVGISEERRLVLEKVGRDKLVLEVGAHTGYFSELLRSQGCTVTAVEMDPAAALKCALKANHVITGDVESPLVRAQITGTFDVVLYMHILEHLVDPWQVLRNTRAWLRPGGSIVILIPNIAAWRPRKTLFFKGTFDYEDVGVLDRTHLRFFTLKSARELVESTGYRVVSWSPIDICVPLERRLRLTPLIRFLSRFWEKWMSRRYPNLCAEILLFQVEPADHPSHRRLVSTK
jgi:O-antigen biosynthesis protein